MWAGRIQRDDSEIMCETQIRLSTREANDPSLRHGKRRFAGPPVLFKH